MGDAKPAAKADRTPRHRAYPAYRDSGVEWLGEVPEGWEVRRLKTVAAARPSNVDKKTVEGQREVRLCNYVDVYKNEVIRDDLDFMVASATDAQVRDFAIRPDDVLATKDSETGDDIAVPALVAVDASDLVCGYHLTLIRSGDQAFGAYLFRAMQSLGVRDQFRLCANGVTRFGLPVAAFTEALFPFPPLPEQRAIAAFLDRETAKIDTLVTQKERLLELLDEKRTALISQAVTKGLDPDVPMKDSGVEWLGEVPARWLIVRSKWRFTLRRTRAWPEDEQLTASQDFGVIPQKEFMARAGRSVVQVLTGSEILKHVEPNDFVISMRSFQGGLEFSRHRGRVSSAYVVLMPSQPAAVGYFSYVFKSKPYIQALQSTSNLVRDGQALRFENFSLVDLPDFSLPEQQAIAAYLDTETARIDALKAKVQHAIDLLKEYRTALISAAVTGKIDVRGEIAIDAS